MKEASGQPLASFLEDKNMALKQGILLLFRCFISIAFDTVGSNSNLLI